MSKITLSTYQNIQKLYKDIKNGNISFLTQKTHKML